MKLLGFKVGLPSRTPVAGTLKCEGAYLPAKPPLEIQEEKLPGQTAIIAGKRPVYQAVRGGGQGGKWGRGAGVLSGSWAGEAWHRGGSRKKGLVNTRLRPFFHPPKRPVRFAFRPRCRPPRSRKEHPPRAPRPGCSVAPNHLVLRSQVPWGTNSTIRVSISERNERPWTASNVIAAKRRPAVNT